MNKREIKFRAWQVDWDDVAPQSPQGKMLYNIPNSAVSTGSFLEMNCTTLQLMQYTGLRDKNTKEIYEGDIVQWYAGIGPSSIGEICFDKYVTDNENNEDMIGWIIVTKYRAYPLDIQGTYEIIGNMYENPELLK